MPFPAKLAVVLAVLGSVGRIAYQLWDMRRERRALAALMSDGDGREVSPSKG
jgi:hypothetical protein